LKAVQFSGAKFIESLKRAEAAQPIIFARGCQPQL